MILAGDIGGTNTRLALSKKTWLDNSSSSASRCFQSEVSRLDENRRPVPPRPASSGGGRLLWLRGAGQEWTMRDDESDLGCRPAELAQSLGIPHVRVINDLEAIAYGVSCLGPQDMDTINAGAPDATGHASSSHRGPAWAKRHVLGRAAVSSDRDRGRARRLRSANELEIELLSFC